MIETFGASGHSNIELENFIRNNFDLRPQTIIKNLDLKKPIYRKLASYGHMGREDLGVRWENLKIVAKNR